MLFVMIIKSSQGEKKKREREKKGKEFQQTHNSAF